MTTKKKPTSKHSQSQKKTGKGSRALADDQLRAASGGAFDAYLKIDGIKGESQEDRHKDWIEVLSYSHRIK